MLLGFIKDERLISYCQAALASKGFLEPWQCCMLIRMDAPDAVMVFADFVDLTLVEIRRLALRADLDANEVEVLRGAEWDKVRAWGEELRLDPHSCLSDLILTALESSNVEHKIFGIMWADFLGEKALLSAWGQAYVFLKDRGYWVHGLAVEKFVQESALTEIVGFFASAESEILKWWSLARLHFHPTAEAEQFLLSNLRSSGVGGAAAHSLGQIRSVAAVPMLIRRVVENVDDFDPNTVRALGRIGHESSIPCLAERLSFFSDEERTWIAWDAAQALGEIRTKQALEVRVFRQICGQHKCPIGQVGCKYQQKRCGRAGSGRLPMPW